MLKFTPKELTTLFDAVQSRIFQSLNEGANPYDEEIKTLLTLQDKLLETKKVDMTPTDKGQRGRIGHIGPKGEQLNEDVQLLDKVLYDKAKGYVIGQLGDKMIVQVQGSTYWVDPKDLKEFAKKPDLTTVPHMKFDEKTQALLINLLY